MSRIFFSSASSIKTLLNNNYRFTVKRCVSYMKSNRNILVLNDRQIFQNVYPESRSPDLYNRLRGSAQCFYCGFDPTADSLHIGNLLAIIALLHCQRAGHQVIALLGGATGQIGDPSGKSKDRDAIDLEFLENNISSIKASLERIFTNHLEYFCESDQNILPAKILNNRDWYKSHNVVDFISTVGRHFRMGNMLAKDSVKSRLGSADGMSWTEFSYQVFQAYDWFYLHKKYNCDIQIGGNDQLGNISAGHEFIHKATSKKVFGLTVPLVTSTTGDKLGKTAGNAVWLNGDRTSPFELYQFYINLPDDDIEKFLKQFTFICDEEIKAIIRAHKSTPEKRIAQKTIAENVTLLVHGKAGVESAKGCTEALFGKDFDALSKLSSKEVALLFRSAPTTEILLEPGTTVFNMVMSAGCFTREVDAERIIKAGGVHVNHMKVTNPDAVLMPGQHILPNHTSLIRVGKKNHYIVKWIAAGIV